MAKKRIIPKLQLMPSQLMKGEMSLVTTVGFDKVIEVGSPISQAKIYEAQAVDELIFVDLSFAKGRGDRKVQLENVQRISEEIFLPITIGGGVGAIEDFRSLLNHGADKVSINSLALQNPQLISDAAKLFGAQCVVLSIDYRVGANGKGQVFSQGGKLAHDISPMDWALKAVELGAGEILLTCIDNDGSRSGLEKELAAEICAAVPIPVIVSGGCGRAAHFVEGFKDIKAEAVSAGTFFSFQDQNPMQTRSHIKNADIPIRIHT